MTCVLFPNGCSLIGKIFFTVEWNNFIISRGKEEMSQSRAIGTCDVDRVVYDRSEFEVPGLRLYSSWKNVHLFRVVLQVGFFS